MMEILEDTDNNLALVTAPATIERLKESFKDPEYADAYARSALNAYIATQIKVIREQRGWTQSRLADEAGMKQPRIAVMEDIDYSSWSISTLWRLARAFHLRLKVSFEEFGTLPYEVNNFSRETLQRVPLEKDHLIAGSPQIQMIPMDHSFPFSVVRSAPTIGEPVNPLYPLMGWQETKWEPSGYDPSVSVVIGATSNVLSITGGLTVISARNIPVNGIITERQKSMMVSSQEQISQGGLAK